jgi:hypothetical protein
MKLIGFTAGEVMAATGCSRNDIASYERRQLLVAERQEHFGKPFLVFTATQLIQIAVLQFMKKTDPPIPAKAGEAIIRFLGQETYEMESQLTYLDGQAFSVAPDWSDFAAKVDSELKSPKTAIPCKLVVLPSPKFFVADIIRKAEQSNRIDIVSFHQRLLLTTPESTHKQL